MRRIPLPRVLLAFALLVPAALTLGGCGDKPSTALAPDVKEPDFSKMSGKELLEYKQKSGGAP